MNSPASTSSGRRALAAIATIVAVTSFVIGTTEVSADPPPAAAGNTSHGFLVDRGVVTTIDHPKATTIPAAPDEQAGTATTGINDHGQVVGAYQGRDRVIRHFVRDRKGRFTSSRIPRAVAMPTSTSTSTTVATSSGSTTTTREPRPPPSCVPGKDGSSIIQVPGAQLTGRVEDQRPATGRGPLRRCRHPARPGRPHAAGRGSRFRLARRRLQDR